MTRTITVEAHISASVEKVWDLYTDPKHIVKWNQASPDWHSPRAENDLRVGGKFKTRMEAKDKSAGFDFEGVYTGVKTHELIEYKMSDGRKARVIFKKVITGTKVIITFDPESVNPVEMQKEGWQAILDSFKKYVELSTRPNCPLCGTQTYDDFVKHTGTHKGCKQFTRHVIFDDGNYLESKGLPGGPCGGLNHDHHMQEGGMTYRYYCKQCFTKERK